MVPAAPTITGTWFAQAVAQPGLVPEVMMSPSVKASVPLISGDGVPQAIVTSFDALLIVRLLNVVALVPPMFCVALEPVNVTLPVVAGEGAVFVPLSRVVGPAAVAVAFWNTIAPPDIVNVVALPSINDSFVPAATVRSVMVPPAIVNCPLAPAVELTMPPVELNAPPFMMKRVVALVVRMSWLVFTVPIFQVPASIWTRPLVTVLLKLPLVTVAAALFSQKPSLTPMITAAMNGVMLLGLECL